jgi:hypothetical protein
MIVVNLNNRRDIYLQSDGTVTDVDTTGSTQISGSFYSVFIYPRDYLDVVDVLIYDELDNKANILECFTSPITKGRQNIFLDFNFVDEKRYLITISNPDTNGLIWRGRLLASDQTNLQEYQTYEENETTGIIEA